MYNLIDANHGARRLEGNFFIISQAPGSRIRSRAIALKYTIKLGLAHHLRKRDRLTLVLIHVMESDLACEAALFPSWTLG